MKNNPSDNDTIELELNDHDCDDEFTFIAEPVIVCAPQLNISKVYLSNFRLKTRFLESITPPPPNC